MDLLPKVFRTEGNITEFDPTKIFESILKETKMDEKDAKHIMELVVRRIISSGMKFLSGPHIFLNPIFAIRNSKSTSCLLPSAQLRSHSQKSFTFTARCGNIEKIKYVHFITILCKQTTASKY